VSFEVVSCTHSFVFEVPPRSGTEESRSSFFNYQVSKWRLLMPAPISVGDEDPNGGVDPRSHAVSCAVSHDLWSTTLFQEIVQYLVGALDGKYPKKNCN
jgi:hypothetical protein